MVSWLWGLFGFGQAELPGALADGVEGGVQDAAIVLYLPNDAPQTGENAPPESFAHRIGRYARIFLGGIGYISTSIGGGTNRIYAAADGIDRQGSQRLPVLGYTAMHGMPELPAPPPPPTPPGAPPPGGGFPGATYVGRVERESRSFRY